MGIVAEIYECQLPAALEEPEDVPPTLRHIVKFHEWGYGTLLMQVSIDSDRQAHCHDETVPVTLPRIK